MIDDKCFQPKTFYEGDLVVCLCCHEPMSYIWTHLIKNVPITCKPEIGVCYYPPKGCGCRSYEYERLNAG